MVANLQYKKTYQFFSKKSVKNNEQVFVVAAAAVIPNNIGWEKPAEA